MIFFLIIVGCTSHGSNPLYPSEFVTNDDSEIFISELNITSYPTSENTRLLGFWVVNFDYESLTLSLIPDRELNAHFNVTDLIPPPQVKVNHYDPVTWVIDVDISITNPSNYNVYDVRGIVLTNTSCQVLLNPDHWTPLYDIKGGNPVNPFKAYAKSQPNRRFAAHATYKENYRIFLGDGSFTIRFAVDASFPSNCEEPYSILGFNHGTLKNFTGAETTAEVYVFDWQNNTSSVYLYCPDVIGQSLIPFRHMGENRWTLKLINKQGAMAGEFNGWIIAFSSDSKGLALFHMVTITVSYATPSNPRIISAEYFTDAFMDVVVDNGHAYIADGSNGLKIFDVANPNQISMMSVLFEIKGYTQNLELRNNYVYIVDFDGGLAVIDVSNKRNPVVVGRLSLNVFQVYDMALSGEYLYIALGSSGITTINVSDPFHPFKVGTTSVREEAMCVNVDGNYLFVAEDYSGLTVFDISNPSSPSQIGFVITPGSARDVAIINNMAFVATYNAGLSVVDVTNKRQPIVLKNIYIPNYPYLTEIYDGKLFVGTIGGITVIDITDPINPQILGQVATKGNPQNIAFMGYLAYVASERSGINIIDVSKPQTPSVIVSTLENSEALNLDIYSQKACISGSDGLKVVDISNPFDPVVLSKIDESGNIDVDGTYAYVGVVKVGPNHQLLASFKIVDISNPLNPRVIYNSWQYPKYLHTYVKVYNGYLIVVYSGYGDSYLEVFNVYKPQAPVFISSLYIPFGSDMAPEAFGNYLYVGSINGISIVDMSKYDSPTIVKTFPCETWMMSRCGNKMITAYNKTISIFDLTNPVNPRYLGSTSINERILDMKAVDNHVYLIAEKFGLKIISIDKPSNPTLMSSISIPRENLSVAVEDRYAYVGKASMGFCVIQLW